ncbi:hypothetical protein Aazo_4527 ['Nostoc azollae' 0708]|jgi:hypothetical protein|uniref:Uncharacterized protein n=1 Tax=Nostoc azollae (strain 0708) TaxID=551115 RepID=D7DX77_NOSA0|nr:hypothetical protein Aazo_4527 ['Nostoc azollae' 0708]
MFDSAACCKKQYPQLHRQIGDMRVSDFYNLDKIGILIYYKEILKIMI